MTRWSALRALRARRRRLARLSEGGEPGTELTSRLLVHHERGRYSLRDRPTTSEVPALASGWCDTCLFVHREKREVRPLQLRSSMLPDPTIDSSGQREPDDATGKRQRASSATNTAYVHDHLRAAILNGLLTAGSAISQKGTAEELGVSRGPVREAFRLLEQEGLLEAHAHRRARVASISPSDLDELYAIRIVSESLVLEMSVPLFTERELAGLADLLQEMNNQEDNSFTDWEHAHRRFHLALMGHAGPRLRQTIEQLYDHARRYRFLYLNVGAMSRVAARADHHAIFNACRARDSKTASRLLAEHLARTCSSLFMTLAPSREPQCVQHALARTIPRTDREPGLGSIAETQSSRPA